MDNRLHLLDLALDLFAARGYDGVGIQEIVDRAGVTKPTLYHYFTNKHGLLVALVSDRLGRLNEQVQHSCQYQGDLPLTLERITRTYFDFARAEPVFYRMQLSMQFAPPDSEPAQVVTPFILEQHALLEDLFVRATRDHGNMRGRQRAYAATLIGMINTYIGIYLAGHGELEDPIVYRAVHQYMHGIFS